MSTPDTDQQKILPLVDSHIARRRRQTYTFLALTMTVTLIGVAALGNWMQWWTLGDSAQAAAPLACPVQRYTSPKLVHVNVYNGTDRRRLAAAVAKELQARKFEVTRVASELRSEPLKEIAVVRHGPDDERAARTVALQFPGKVRILADDRGTEDVDVILGEKYKVMRDRKKALVAVAITPRPMVCTPATHAPN